MHILFYRCNNIFEPSVIAAFQDFNIEVIQERAAMTQHVSNEEIVRLIGSHILEQAAKGTPFLFIFSINFVPALSEICNKLHILYVCWSVDCPVMELFSTAIRNPYNCIFLFDYSQYEHFQSYNPDNIFYLPLGSDYEKLQKTIASITKEDREKYACDISFVGSLYKEYNPFHKINNLDAFTTGYIEALVDAQIKIYSYNFIEDVLTDEMIEKIKQAPLEWDSEKYVEPVDRYAAAHLFIGMKIAEKERTEMLNTLAKSFSVNLYTRSDTSALSGINVCGEANSASEMPKIFHLSKINLNSTIRPIQTGLSLRVYDVLGCGGFLITNYQAELPELFTIGEDLESYSSMDELTEKCAYYLHHDTEREAIAANGFQKICRKYSCKQRVSELLPVVYDRLQTLHTT